MNNFFKRLCLTISGLGALTFIGTSSLILASCSAAKNPFMALNTGESIRVDNNKNAHNLITACLQRLKVETAASLNSAGAMAVLVKNKPTYDNQNPNGLFNVYWELAYYYATLVVDGTNKIFNFDCTNIAFTNSGNYLNLNSGSQFNITLDGVTTVIANMDGSNPNQILYRPNDDSSKWLFTITDNITLSSTSIISFTSYILQRTTVIVTNRF
jgi:hypothetical protein